MIYIDNNLKTPIYAQIYEQLKKEILNGSITSGEKLMSTRMLAKSLCVSRNTVEMAYAQLCIEGYVNNKPGSGFIVPPIHNNAFLERSWKSSEQQENYNTVAEKPSANPEVDYDIQELTFKGSEHYAYNFHYANLAEEVFPCKLWSRMLQDIFLEEDTHKKLSIYNDFQGELELRTEIMHYLNKARGVKCTEDQIFIYSGLQSALNVICLLFKGMTNIFAFEEPTNDSARIVPINHDYIIAPIAVKSDGIDVDALAYSRAGIVFVTPSHQFPTGVVMSITNRMRILNWAARHNAVIIEDDYNSELRYHSSPIPSLQSIDTEGRVIYLGTFSKALSPDLRISYLVFPKWLLPRRHAMFSRYHSTVPWLSQQVLYHFIKSGQWERHVRKICNVFEKRHDTLIETLRSTMGDRIILHGCNAGSHILLEFPDGKEGRWLIERAKAHDVKVYPITPMYYHKENCPNNMLLMGFGMIGEEKITQGVLRLKEAWFGP